MASSIRDFFFGTINKKAELVEAMVPQRTFQDVILPPATRRALDHALIQIKKHDLIFHQWGLAERHVSGLALAFNFAGPPGTGKTICAEAIATSLGKRLLVVRYSEMESLWAGETGKNVASVFRAAQEQDAVLFFDEADAIAGRRFTAVTQGYQREANTVVNVLLRELEEFNGVVIFATNLAANFDPAFERRVRTHILFEMPGAAERAQIWQVQLHARKTPLADDVDFEALGQKYQVSGGEIKNAVLKAAQIATTEPGPDAEKRIHQRHFEMAMVEVLAAKKVMDQSLFAEVDGSHALSALTGLNGAWSQLSRGHEEMEAQVQDLTLRLGEVERHSAALPGIVERFDDASRASQLHIRAELAGRIDELDHRFGELTAQLKQLVESSAALAKQLPEIRTATDQVLAEAGTTRTQIEDHRARLEDLFTRLQKEQEIAVAARDDTEARWKKQWILSLSVAVVGLLVALSALIAAIR